MSFPVSASPNKVIRINAEKESTRRSANFDPTIWGDYFLSYTGDFKESGDASVKHQELKKEIRTMLRADINKPSQTKLDLIDDIQRLGVSYHFESEIDEILQKMHEANQDCDLGDDENVQELYYISLQFRLLRQNGYKISADVFNSFKDSNGNFKSFLKRDIRGMLSLYEAAHLRVHGENILNEALTFTVTHLESFTSQSNTQLAAQKQHQEELRDIVRWWKNFDVPNKLPFIRDRVVEGYFWILGVYFEPKFLLARKILTKVISMASIIDDIYDAYGTIEELELFATAIERWDLSAIDLLPEYMKLCYSALLDAYSEFEKDLASKGILYGLPFAKESMKILVRSYIIEARWCDQQYVPTMEEYMRVALLSCGYLLLSTSSFLGMEDIVTKEAFEWVSGNPKIVQASSIICRLMDDIVSHKFEQQRGHVASAVECYMKQHGVSEEEAVKVFREKVGNAWKDINEELMRPPVVPMPLLERVLNLARLMDVLYQNNDSYTNPHLMKDHVAALLKDPVFFED
ncbi:alpha-terpineol synthase [Citrus sinensis]|uniref:Alpha-terpineol synthase n=1 Tax=Citrus sinensis TaxID=2711 RepID=A0ACB8NZK3_CITSI|nr:alpha-terpineol synthase [Citrus sinensis]